MQEDEPRTTDVGGVPLDRLSKMVERRLISTVYLTSILLRYCAEDRVGLERLLEVAGSEERARVFDVLTMYPQTEFGWSLLPERKATFAAFNVEELSQQEAWELERRPYREDRDDVEYLRVRIRSTTI